MLADPSGIERLWLEEQMKEKTFDTLFGGGKGESMEKKTSRIKERFLPVSKSLPSLMVTYL